MRKEQRDYIIEVLTISSDNAIQIGNECKGYLGLSINEFSKSELIKYCNILHSAYKESLLDKKLQL